MYIHKIKSVVINIQFGENSFQHFSQNLFYTIFIILFIKIFIPTRVFGQSKYLNYLIFFFCLSIPLMFYLNLQNTNNKNEDFSTYYSKFLTLDLAGLPSLVVQWLRSYPKLATVQK